ncbi:MAG: GAF domain-containing protein [Caldilineaceae bacterium]|nr:GAF domain-containing protein [Caldilineaceae bacterium]
MTTQPITPSPNRTIPERWLPVVWVAWLIYALVVLTIHIQGTPLYLADLQAPASSTVGAWERPTYGDAAILPQLGIALAWYARYITLWALLYGVTLYAAGVFIFWRRSQEIMALIVSITLLSLSLGENSIDHLLKQTYPWWNWPVEFNQMVGAVLLLWIGYLFPNGRLVPSWTQWPMIGWSLMNVFWFLFPGIPLNHLYGETAERHLLATFLLVTGCYLTGLYAQIYRYRYVSTYEQRTQTRWVLLGFGANFLNTAVRFLPLAIMPTLNEPGIPRLVHILVGFPLANLLGMVSPITLVIALLRYRLWLVDPILNRAMVYTLLTAALTGIYLMGLYGARWLLPTLATPNSAVAIFIATATAALLFAPIRTVIQRYIDRAFQRERIDAQAALRTLQHEIRTILNLPDLLERLVVRLTEQLHATHGVIYLADETAELSPTQRHGPIEDAMMPLLLTNAQRQRLQDGIAVVTNSDPYHTLLVPLTAPQSTAAPALVGVLALGRRQNGQPYSRADLALLETLGAQAGTAITVAQLAAEEQTRLVWRNSAAGRAAMLAAELPTTPAALLPALHELASRAHADLEAANVLRHLVDAFQQQGHAVAAALAQGYYYLVTGYREPALLIIGLRTLVTELDNASAAAWPAAAAMKRPLTALLHGLQAETIPQITAAAALAVGQPLADAEAADAGAVELCQAQQRLQQAVAFLAAYTRVDASDEQMGLLVQTLDQLTALTHEPAAPLSPPVHTLLLRIAEQWRTVITRQAAALRRQARIQATLVTRRLFAPAAITDDAISSPTTLLLALTNQGRGQAADLVIQLAIQNKHGTQRDSNALNEQRLSKLAAGESMQVAFALPQDNHFDNLYLPLCFTVRYRDEEGLDQQLIYHDELCLLPTSGPFQPIPNPYVAGAPLRPQSPTFVGRQRDLHFIRHSLSQRGNNVALVLTGQRRIGKTSLLQQLLVQLGDNCAPVYLDCQALGIEPGLGRLLVDVAAAIAATLNLAPPEPTSFGDRPSVHFERTFLPQIQQVLGGRRLLLLFDEFEELEARVDRGRLEPELFPYLRHLIQHSPNLAVLFAGTHRLHDLNPTYWSAFFNVAQYRRMGHLSLEDARHLITAPVAPLLQYDDLALEWMLRVSGKHPYFLQLLCYTLVNRANAAERSYITAAQVRAAIDETLNLAESHLLYLWGRASPELRPVLHAAADVGRDGAAFTPAEVYGYLAAQAALPEQQCLSEREIAERFNQLASAEILEPVRPGEPRYRFRLELLRLWIVLQGHGYQRDVSHWGHI